MKERLAGAGALFLLAVIILPLLLDDTRMVGPRITTTNIPEQPQEEFTTRLPPDPAATATLAGKEEPAPVADTTAPVRADRGPLTGWVVQVGSFSRDNAARLNDKLRAAGYRSYVVAEPVKTQDGATLYRVRVGPQVLRSEAVQLKDKLQQEMELKGLILKYP